MTFEWEDITDEFLEKIVCFSFSRSSGQGDPGMLEAVTENGQEYLIGLYCTREKETEIRNRFLGYYSDTNYAELKRTHEIGKWYCTEFLFRTIFIRKDCYDMIYPEWEKQRKRGRISPTEVARDLLDPKGKQPRVVLSETQAIWDEEERKRREAEEWKAANRLVEGEDYEWKEIEAYSERGYYLLLFKENEDGSISGSRWTIVCQQEQIEEGSIRAGAPVEAYNLYYKSYENMGGILEYPEDGKREDKEIYRYTTLTDDPKEPNHGKFHRTYFTLEQAKSAALTRNEYIGWGNYYKVNLLKRNWSEMSLVEAKKDYLRAVKREKELQLLFPTICGEVLRIMSKYNWPGNAVTEICESLRLSKSDVRFFMCIFSHSSMFSKCGLEEAEKILSEAKDL